MSRLAKTLDHTFREFVIDRTAQAEKEFGLTQEGKEQYTVKVAYREKLIGTLSGEDLKLFTRFCEKYGGFVNLQNMFIYRAGFRDGLRLPDVMNSEIGLSVGE